MRVYENFPYTGRAQQWEVPEGVLGGIAFFECWGAAGGMSSHLVHAGAKRETRGGTGERNDDFTNSPHTQGRLGQSFANNAGYAAGTKPVEAGEVYHVYVGGNGEPGHSSVRRRWNDTFYVRAMGGAGGWNGGAPGGAGKRVDRNLFNAPGTNVRYSQNGIPNKAKKGQKWHDTNADKVYIARRNYSGGGQMSYWRQITALHTVGVGPSGGGGGGATDIRQGGDALSDRILVAGGSGGAAGSFSTTGPDAWNLAACPTSPVPPFGADNLATGPRGVNDTWATLINYLTGGWGRGGVGGAAEPAPGALPTADGGSATVGGTGGPGTNRHAEGVRPTVVQGSEGKGGSATHGGAAGKGGLLGGDGVLGVGGQGANASGETAGSKDDWCAGGGGGGGGWYGGGGGGQGFRVAGKSATVSETRTNGGGGGGGSNYAGPQMTVALLLGCARPPQAKGSESTGADGRGGFARIGYNLAPRTVWAAVPTTATEAALFPASFRFFPAVNGGTKVDFVVVGTGSPSAEFPTTQSVVNISNKDADQFTYNFTGPTAGAQTAIFVKTVDQDGDSSPWLKHIVTGVSAPVPATITSPAPGAQFVDQSLVAWTPGAQSPLVAYRLGLTGEDLVTPATIRDYPTPYRPGGSRVNLATDPGFVGSAVWSAPYDPSGEAVLEPSTDFPGVSGSCGKIVWTPTTNEDAANVTVAWDNLQVGLPYRFALKVASGTDNDIRGLAFEVSDKNGPLTSHVEDSFSTVAAGSYAQVVLTFTPTGQGVTLAVRPEDSIGVTGNAEAGQTTYLADLLLEMDFAAQNLLLDTFAGAASNLVLNPSAETNIDGYDTPAAEGSLSHDPALGFFGEASVKNTRGTEGPQYTYYNLDGGTGLADTLVEVAEGTVYQGSARARHTAAGDLVCELSFWDTDGAFLEAHSTLTAAVAADTWTKLLTPLAEAPVDAVYATLRVGRDDGLGDLHVDWFVISENSPVADAHDPPAAWQALAGNGGQVIPDSAGRESEGALKYVAGGGTDIVEHTDSLGVPVHEGLTYEFSGQLFADTTSSDAHAQIDWRNAAGDFISSSVGAAVTLTLDDWAEAAVVGVAPAGAAYLHPAVEFEDALAGEVFYMDDFWVSTATPSYFDGSNLNGNVGAPSWDGATNASASTLTGTDVEEDLLVAKGIRLGNGSIYLDTFTDESLILGASPVRAEVDAVVNPFAPAAPIVDLTINRGLGVMTLEIDADDGASDYATTSFEIFRNGVRIVKGLTPDPTTRTATYTDVPAHGEQATYRVRALAIDPANPHLRPGYTDVSDGTVTTVG